MEKVKGIFKLIKTIFKSQEYAQANGMSNLTEYKTALNDKALVKKFTQDLEKHCLKCMFKKKRNLFIIKMIYLLRWF